MKMQFNIMISDIDKIKNKFQCMNILQLKWILYNLIQKNIFNRKFTIQVILMIQKLYIDF